jgi:hypothetical protein
MCMKLRQSRLTGTTTSNRPRQILTPITITACSIYTISAAPSTRWPAPSHTLSTPLRLTLRVCE